RHTRFSRDWSSDVCSSDLRAVGTDPHVAQALPEIGEHGFLGHDVAVRGQLEADERAVHHRDQQVALPRREGRAVIDGNVAGIMRRRTERPDRVDRAFDVAGTLGRRLGIVVIALRHAGPTVMPAALDTVDLVAAARAELGRPHRAGGRIDRQPGRIAMALAPDYRRIAFPADERVVARHTAIAIEAQDLADMVIGLLRQLAVVAVPAGDEEITILVDRHAPAVAAER